MPKKFLLTDLCAALKLAALGEAFFTSQIGQKTLAIHPVLFEELSKWDRERQDKWEPKITLLRKIGATKEIEISKEALDAQRAVVWLSTHEDARLLSPPDQDQLATALELDIGLVTNDDPLFNVADDFELDVCTAEQLLGHAIDRKAATTEQVTAALTRWKETGDLRIVGNADLVRRGVTIPE